MTFEIFSELQYQVYLRTTFIFSIQACRTDSQVILEESLFTDPWLTYEEIAGDDGISRFIRVRSNGNNHFTIRYQAKVDIDYNTIHQRRLAQTVPVSRLEAEEMHYLFPSRYCQSDNYRNSRAGNLEILKLLTAK